MEIDLRNIIALVGVLFAIIGLGCSGGLYGKVSGVSQCCGDIEYSVFPEDYSKVPSGCMWTVAGTEIPCVSPKSCSEEIGVVHDGCCLSMSGNAGKNDVIFAAIILGTVIFTGVMAEFAEKCPACMQNCSACILGTANILGLIFVILIAYFSFQTTGSEDSSGGSDATGCSDKTYTVAAVVDAEGLLWASLIFLILAQLSSCVVAVMTSSCFQDKD